MALNRSRADFTRIVWSNFEIGDLDFWRGEAYSKFFEFLDSKGGFYYEVCSWLFDHEYHLLTTVSSAGVMHPSTVSAPPSLQRRNRFTSSTTSVSHSPFSLCR